MNNDWKATEINEGQPVKPSGDNLPYPSKTMQIYTPETICEFDMFGQKQLVICFHKGGKFPIPNRWIRFWTKVFFNSKWDFKK